MTKTPPKSPQEISKEVLAKKTYSFSLIKKNVDTMSALANESNIPISYLIDEAIKYYLQNLDLPKSK